MARLDTGWHNHAKVLQSGAHGMALHAWSISYCDAARTDGFVPAQAWPGFLTPGVKPLLKLGLFEPVEGGYQLHDYADYNRLRVQIEAEQHAANTRQSRHRSRVTNGVTEPVTNGVSNGVTLARAAAPGPGPGINSRPPAWLAGRTAGAREAEPPEVLSVLSQPSVGRRFDRGGQPAKPASPDLSSNDKMRDAVP